MLSPGAPLTYFNDGVGGGGSMKDTGIFLGHEKNSRDLFGLQKKDKGIFGGMLKK